MAARRIIRRQMALTEAATPASPQAPRMDVRVASSLFVSLRFHIHAWMADLEAHLRDLEREQAALTARRGELLRQLLANESARRHVLNDLARYAPRDIVRCFHEGLGLVADIGLFDRRLASIRRKREDVARQRFVVGAVREVLLRIHAGGGLAVDELTGRLSTASRQIFRIVDEHNDATARAILDGPMQRLSEAALEAELAMQTMDRDDASAIEHTRRCRIAAREAAQTLDELLARLRPVTPDRSLVQATLELLHDPPAAAATRFRVLGAERRLSAVRELALYRIVAEAVSNAMRHGHPAQVDVVISFHPRRVAVMVKDDGDGFDVAATEARLGRTEALGLIEMQERAALVGSRLELRSLIGAGTEVRTTVSAR